MEDFNLEYPLETNLEKTTMERKMSEISNELLKPGEELSKSSENDDFYNSDESEKPFGERWAPVGANDGDNEFKEFKDEYKGEFKYNHSIEK